jgi:Transposase DDE domain
VNRDTAGALLVLDAHPLLREYFARELREQRPEAWRAAHRRLYEHLCATTKDKAQPSCPRSKTGELHLIVDSTGLKLRGVGEWLFEKHGTSKRRSWRKLHIGIDADSDEIVAFDLTDKEVDDASHVEPLLEQLDDAPASFMGDGAYDRSHVPDTVLAKNPTVRFIVPPCKGAMLGSTATTAPSGICTFVRSLNMGA